MRLTLEFNALVWLDTANLSILVWIPQREQQKVFVRCMLAQIQLCASPARACIWTKEREREKHCGHYMCIVFSLSSPFLWNCHLPDIVLRAAKTYRHTRMLNRYIGNTPAPLCHPFLIMYLSHACGMISASRLDVCTTIWPWKICVRLHAFVSWIGPQAVIHYSCYVSDSMGWY